VNPNSPARHQVVQNPEAMHRRVPQLCTEGNDAEADVRRAKQDKQVIDLASHHSG
jgi:hypothetical protein